MKILLNVGYTDNYTNVYLVKQIMSH